MKLYYTYNNMHSDLLQVIRKLQKEDFKPDLIVGVARGGLIPAVELSQWYDIPLISIHYSLRDHPKQETLSQIDIDQITNKNVIIIDDICDSGETMRDLYAEISKYNTSIKTICLFHNLGQDIFEPDIYIREVNKVVNPVWIVYPWENWWE